MTFVKLLYGSRARGEADQLSDTDLLVVSDGADADYSWPEMGRLRDYGSLFLWHLHLEARVVGSDDAGYSQWAALVSNIPNYQRVDQDLGAFETVLEDISIALRVGDTSLLFEGDVLARTVRHAAILACYLAGAPNFSRYGAVDQALVVLGAPSEPSMPFTRLYDCVLQPSEVTIKHEDLHEWVACATDLVSWMRAANAVAEVC